MLTSRVPAIIYLRNVIVGLSASLYFQLHKLRNYKFEFYFLHTVSNSYIISLLTIPDTLVT